MKNKNKNENYAQLTTQYMLRLVLGRPKSGQEIQAGGKSFGKTNRKEFTRWESALNTLVSNSLVTTRGHKGEFFELTHEGWTVAESL